MTAETRDAMLRRFVRETFGLRGTLGLHRAAFGLDLVRAPVNVVLAPIFLLVKLLGLIARLCRAPRLAGWLLSRRIVFETAVSRKVAARVRGLVAELDAAGVGPGAPEATVARAVEDYVGVRNAVAEITTVLFVLITGWALFHSATLGVISLAGPVADMRAQALAIENYWAGQWLGQVYFGWFPRALDPWQVVATGVALAMLASLVTTFAGVVADPVQRWLGIHRRRLTRLMARLDRQADSASGLSREHAVARLGDLTDIALALWRALRP
ncbi:DUF6635 family protein [Oceanicola sp. 502str15]|uniref:DUF6635 family protein n=1 Tax=Oceanicola sp. 502str15 TaxID=2696061 RepID=UPI00273A5EB7|nr:DUF6635 family protein [Oceanicola sp. 502str15]MCO6383063.1 hypothetical protein [Oceanicola sp. 502str15]